MIVFVLFAMAIWGAVMTVLRFVWFVVRPLTWPVRVLVRHMFPALWRKRDRNGVANQAFFKPPPDHLP